MLKFGFILGLLAIFLSSQTHAGEESLYDFLWLDPDKKVYVLQNKLYKKEHSFYLDVGYLANFTSKFQDTQGFQAKTGFYFREEWAFELGYQQYSNGNNDEFRNIRLINQTEPFIRRLNSSYGANLIWSPFYGKINTFNQIIYFDWSFGVGATIVNAESNLKTATNNLAVNKYRNETYGGAVAKTGVKFHLKENIHVGVEYMNTYYRAPSPQNPKSDKLRTNTDVILSVGLSF